MIDHFNKFACWNDQKPLDHYLTPFSRLEEQRHTHIHAQAHKDQHTFKRSETHRPTLGPHSNLALQGGA